MAKQVWTMSTIFNIARDKEKTRKTAEAGTETGECRKRLGLLYEVAQKTSSVSEVSKVVEEILYMTRQIIPSLASSLFIIDENKGKLYFKAADESTGNKLNQIGVSPDSGIASWVLSNGKPLIINDVSKDERFNREIDKAIGFTTRSVMSVPLLRGQKTIGILEAINRSDGQEFNEQDLALLEEFASTEELILLVSMAATAINNIEQHQILIDWYKTMFETLIANTDAKDPYAYGHSCRVKKYTMLAANSLSFSLEELQAIEFGALLHDIGKLGIHDVVLRKSGPLTDEEWYIMRKHSLRGAQMLSGIPYLEKVREIVLYHHERYDGKGYPQGLKGKDIPMGARLVAVADAYDTMTTAHSYRDKMSINIALNQLINGSGTQFCPVAVNAFVSAFEKSNEKQMKTQVAHPAIDEQQKEAEELTKAEGASPAIHNPGLEIYEGDVALMITSPDGFGQVKQFKECLEKLDNLKISFDRWSETEGLIIVVSVKKPVALTSLLKKMPMVEKVDKHRDGLAVMLKTSAADKAFKHGFSLAWPR